jgi:hypothetical protein
MPSHAVGLCAPCQVPALTAFALAARPARLPADEAAPDIDINSDEEKIVRVQAGLRGLSRRKIVAAAQVDGGGPIRQRVNGLPSRVPS